MNKAKLREIFKNKRKEYKPNNENKISLTIKEVQELYKIDFKNKSLKEFEEILQNANFFRIHKSYLVNIAYVTEFDSSKNVVHMNDGVKLEVARRRREEFLKVFSV